MRALLLAYPIGIAAPRCSGLPNVSRQTCGLSNADSPYPMTAHGAAGATGGGHMAKKPNYRFERSERERQKALKKAARLAAKQEKSDARKDDETGESPAQPTED
jgi:hypothetical protein